MNANPPRVATWLLEQLLPEESRDAVIGDLVEAYDAMRSEHPVRARVQYWREAIAALASLQTTPHNVTAYTPATRESLMQSVLADVRHALRVLRRAPAFTILCAATLGLAIGATTIIFSVVNPILLRPLPYPDAEQIVAVYERDRDGSASRVGYATYKDLRSRARSLQHSAAFGDWQPTIFGSNDGERVQGQRVSWEYFRTLGVRPLLGRDFTEADDTPATNNVVILSHALFTRRYGADPAIVGRTLNISGVTRTVVGVMPPSFDDVMQPDAQIWRVLGYAESDGWACRTCRHLQMIARVRESVPLASAAAELDGAAKQIATEHPSSYAGEGALTIGLQEQVTRNVRPILLVLLGSVIFLLLIAGANVINLQLARAVRRGEEFAVRAALGAGRRRIAQQLLSEGLVLTSIAALVGVGIAAAGLPLVTQRLPEGLPRVSAVGLDWRVFAFVAAATLLVGLAVGLVPALGAGRARLFDVLRGGGRSLGGTHHRARAALVIGEVALALMLLVGATLLGRSLVRLMSVDAGFDASNLITMEVQAAGARYDSAAHVFANHDRIREVVAALPGVESVGLTTQLPLGGNLDRYGVIAQDKPLPNPELAPDGERFTIGGDFMRTMRIDVIRGRRFTGAEARDSNVKVVIVSQSLANHLWPGEDPLGKQLRVGGPSRPWREVIGVAEDIRHTGLDATVSQQFYVPERQWFGAETQMTLVVRTTSDPASLVGAVREAVRSVDPLQPIAKVATMDQVVARSTSQRRLGLMLFAAFSTMAILLACAGIYGVLAGAVSERAREIGLRSALGATPRAIVSLVLRQGARLAVVGLLLGVGGAFALSRYLRTLLFGIEAHDPVSVVVAVGVIAAVALLACVVPARRAVRVDPMTALRSE
ncbi:MAG TPA: ADOP family duplicated permease [Gemmatimonadaceae bacterium]|nr:ADOP family duplicated permease [Gemmatimonadaceae bacterium]